MPRSPRNTATATSTTEPLALDAQSVASFAPRLLAWFDNHGRHDLPWQHPRSAYRVWLSEIMLQQTQVQTVIPYFLRFLDALPTLPDLARASSDEVMALWSGLGYYARARNLHAAARHCLSHHNGELPMDFEALVALPGIGRSTAGAILAQADGQKIAILDGNVKRVLSRWQAIDGWPNTSAVEAKLWQISNALLPESRLADYTQALMDLGATLCTRSDPSCLLCPLKDDCAALREGRTAELPTPKPTKTIPHRQCSVLVAIDRDKRVFLQQRVETGVWQGLWSLLQAESEQALIEKAASLIADHGQSIHLASFEHVFSHYRLTIHPIVWLEATATAQINDNLIPSRWAAREEWPNIGLPAPIRKLLDSLELL